MRRIWRKAVMAFALISLIALPTIPAVALLVRPILINLTTTGSGANGSLEVVNDRNRPMAVEVKVNKLDVPERGAVIVTPDEGSDFQIFPPIASIPAGGRQIFRIRWIGEPNLAASRLFMFSTAELPVAETTGQTSVQVLYAIQSVVAVRPPQARSAIEVAEVRRAKSPKGEDGLEIIFANEGAAHGFVSNGQLEIGTTGSSWSRTLASGDLNNAFGLGLIPPNARRAMFLKVEDLPAEGAPTAKIQTPQAR